MLVCFIFILIAQHFKFRILLKFNVIYIHLRHYRKFIVCDDGSEWKEKFFSDTFYVLYKEFAAV